MYLLIKDGKVVNKIAWNGNTPYTPPNGCEVVDYQGANQVEIGMDWNGEDVVPVVEIVT